MFYFFNGKNLSIFPSTVRVFLLMLCPERLLRNTRGCARGRGTDSAPGAVSGRVAHRAGGPPGAWGGRGQQTRSPGTGGAVPPGSGLVLEELTLGGRC